MADGVAAILPVSPAVGQIAQLAPAVGATIPPPSALLSVGAPPPPALTYDASGLLRAFPSSLGQLAGTAANAASVDAAALTGVNGTAARSGLLNSPVSLQAVPANALGAVERLVAAQAPSARAVTIRDLQTNALNAALTGLDVPSSSAAVLNATGALETLTPDQATAALIPLQATDVGQAAAALNVNSDNASFLDPTGLLLVPAGDATSQALSGLLTSSLSLANAQFSANLAGAPAVSVGSRQVLADVLASDVNLTTAATQAAAATTATTSATVTVAGLPTPVAAPALTAGTAPPAAVPTTVTPTAAPTVPPVPGGTPAVTPAPPATATVAGTINLTPVAPTGAATAAVNLNFLVDAAALAANNIAGNPNYAAMAATLYAHAAVARAQPGPGRGGPNIAMANVADLPSPIAGTLGIRAARRI